MAAPIAAPMAAAYFRPQIVAVLGRNWKRDVLAAGQADMIELRLDLIEEADPLQALQAVREACKARPIIATARIRTEGGGFSGSEQERIGLLLRAEPHCDYLDIELMAPGRDELLAAAKRPAIVSYHDFQGMPDPERMDEIFSAMKKAGAAISKIAMTPQSLQDNIKILQFLQDADAPLCMIAMGTIGRHLRAVAPLYGSALTYGYITDSTAPGQMSLHDLCLARDLLEKY